MGRLARVMVLGVMLVGVLCATSGTAGAATVAVDRSEFRQAVGSAEGSSGDCIRWRAFLIARDVLDGANGAGASWRSDAVVQLQITDICAQTFQFWFAQRATTPAEVRVSPSLAGASLRGTFEAGLTVSCHPSFGCVSASPGHPLLVAEMRVDGIWADDGVPSVDDHQALVDLDAAGITVDVLRDKVVRSTQTQRFRIGDLDLGPADQGATGNRGVLIARRSLGVEVRR